MDQESASILGRNFLVDLFYLATRGWKKKYKKNYFILRCYIIEFMSKRNELLRSLRELGNDELLRRVEELRGELFGWKTLTKVEGRTNPAKIKSIKKEIARIKTILKEREIQQKKQEIQK
ncbi:MAG: 50S ribosomal protein L29 [bacterium]|nr:50S ribosomal protein L29 [bacterium]